jgi:hypothetical protein
MSAAFLFDLVKPSLVRSQSIIVIGRSLIVTGGAGVIAHIESLASDR